jgi:putative selenium metabolism hydrolase
MLSFWYFWKPLIKTRVRFKPGAPLPGGPHRLPANLYFYSRRKENAAVQFQINQKDLTSFTQKLIKTPSNSGEEGPIAALIAAEMKKLGYTDVSVDKKNSVMGVIKGGRPGKNLLFNGHIDHAEVGSMADPYSGKIIDGRLFGTEGRVIYGRGACDMKAAVAAMVYAGAQLQNEKASLPGNVFISAVALEEQARGEGITFQLDHTDHRFDAAVSGEATDMEVHLGHRGKFEYILKVFGKTAHSSNPARGVNAIFLMNKLLSEIEESYARGLPEHDFLGKATVTVIDILARPGRLTPVIPDYCEIVFDRRYLPGEDKISMEKEIEALFKKLQTRYPDFRAEYEQNKDFPVLFCPPGETIVSAARKAAEEVLHRVPDLKSWKFGVDGAFISRRGIPCIGFGPGNEHFAHTVEDHVRVEDIYSAAKVYCRIPYFLNDL